MLANEYAHIAGEKMQEINTVKPRELQVKANPCKQHIISKLLELPTKVYYFLIDCLNHNYVTCLLFLLQMNIFGPESTKQDLDDNHYLLGADSRIQNNLGDDDKYPSVERYYG